MARPKKIGLEYFPLDCQMDDKVEMLEAEHGLEGFAVYIKLLQAIYQTDAGELDMSVIFRWKTLGKQWGIPAENLRKMVDTMLEVALFDKVVFEERQVLTSGGIAKRISQVALLRDRDRRRKTEGEPEFSDGKPTEKYIKGKGKDTTVSQKEKERQTELNSETLSSFQSESVATPEVEQLPFQVIPLPAAAQASRTKGAARFTPPSYEQILAYMQTQRPAAYVADLERVATKCFGHYTANGWKVGRNPMKSWEGGCQTFLSDLPKTAPPHPPRYASSTRTSANGTVASLPAGAYQGQRPGTPPRNPGVS